MSLFMSKERRVLKKGMWLLVLLLVFSSVSVIAQSDFECPGTLPPRLMVGGEGRTTPGEPNNVRDQPTTGGALVGEIPGETVFYVNDGPVCADGYVWWMVGYQDVYGWTVEGAGEEYWTEPYPPMFVIDGTEIAYENITFAFDAARSQDPYRTRRDIQGSESQERDARKTSYHYFDIIFKYCHF